MDKSHSWIDGEISIQSRGSESQVRLDGSHEAILFNWTMVTKTVCQELHIPAVALAALMPSLVQDVERLGKTGGITGIKLDLAAMKREGGNRP